METLIIILTGLMLAGVLYLIYLQSKKQHEKADLLNTLSQVDANLQHTILGQLNGLQQNLSTNFESNRKELLDIQSRNFKDSRDFLKLIEGRMDQMGQGLGEISKVNDFMQMLFNPASRGRVGEVQLEGLLKEVLAPNQYEKNFQPYADSQMRVEFAIKMPTDLGQAMYLPIDSKFPKEEYQRLIQAESKEDIARCQQSLTRAVKEYAKSIARYIHVPRTTDMAMMYLPDGIFDWVAAQSELVSELRTKYKVVVTGPTTLWTMLSFVSYFFRLMVINEKSQEVWELLGKFKKQMGMTLDIIDKAIHYNRKAGEKMDMLRTTRYKVMMRELKEVEEPIDENSNDIAA